MLFLNLLNSMNLDNQRMLKCCQLPKSSIKLGRSDSTRLEIFLTCVQNLSQPETPRSLFKSSEIFPLQSPKMRRQSSLAASV